MIANNFFKAVFESFPGRCPDGIEAFIWEGCFEEAEGFFEP